MKLGGLYFNHKTVYIRGMGSIQIGTIFRVKSLRGGVTLQSIRGTEIKGDNYVNNSSAFKPISEYGDLFSKPLLNE